MSGRAAVPADTHAMGSLVNEACGEKTSVVGGDRVNTAEFDRGLPVQGSEGVPSDGISPAPTPDVRVWVIFPISQSIHLIRENLKRREEIVLARVEGTCTGGSWQMHAVQRGETPTGVLIFRDADAEPRLTIFTIWANPRAPLGLTQ